jgi:PAS domain S-box-containing protein
MLTKEFKNSIRFKFFRVIFIILLIGSLATSIGIAVNESRVLEQSLLAKAKSLASYIGKFSLDALIIKDRIQLDAIVSEANRDEDVVYTIIRDVDGAILTSQYASINFRSPRLRAVLARLPKDMELSDVIAGIAGEEPVKEISSPVFIDIKQIGMVTIGVSQQVIRQQVLKTVVIILALNIAVALALGVSLFLFSKRIILTPLAELSAASAQLARGDLSTKVIASTTGEVKMLIDSFNRMSEDLEKTTVSMDYVNDIIGSMRDALIVLSPDGTITRGNMAACFLLEYGFEELVGLPIDRVVLDGPAAESSTLAQVLNAGSVSALEKTYLARSGKKVPVLFSASIMRGSDGEVHGIVCVAQDIAERKRNEEKLKAFSEDLQEINEELKSFAYIVSHDLRAPLVNIRGFSEELNRALQEIGPCFEKHLPHLDQADREKVGPLLHKDIPEAISFIGSSVSRMDNLISAILKLSRAGRRTLSLEPVSVQELVGTIVSSLAHQIGSRNISVNAQDLPEVIADKMALEQILGNLLDNAVKYLEPARPGELEVSVERNLGEAIFHVRDNGRGMAKGDIPKAFEIFRRVGRQDVPGEGMGLAYVKALVRLHGGRIWCASEPGKGTTFSFTLPQQLEDQRNNGGQSVPRNALHSPLSRKESAR